MNYLKAPSTADENTYGTEEESTQDAGGRGGQPPGDRRQRTVFGLPMSRQQYEAMQKPNSDAAPHELGSGAPDTGGTASESLKAARLHFLHATVEQAVAKAELDHWYRDRSPRRRRYDAATGAAAQAYLTVERIEKAIFDRKRRDRGGPGAPL